MSATVTQPHLVEPASEQLVQGLATEVEETLWREVRLRSTDSLVAATATADGVVTLVGHVRGDMLRAVAGQLALQVPGVTKVINGLVADTDLESDIAEALATDPAVQAFTDRTTVKVILGVVQLSGTISGEDLAAAEAARTQAEKVARSVPGVREVLNNTRAIVGTASVAELTDEAAPTDAGGAEAAVMQARLLVWRERQSAK